MGMPTVFAVGTSASNINAASPGLPAGFVADDIFMLYIETQDVAVVPATTGYTEITNVFVSTGNATRLTLRWRRAVAGDTAPSVGETANDHCCCQILGIRGCITTGNPYEAVQTSQETTSDGTVSIAGSTTLGPDRLVLAAFSTGADIASTVQASAWSDVGLGSVTERADFWAAAGLGGGFGVASGTKAVAGAWGPTLATLATPNFKAQISLAMIGATAAAATTPPRRRPHHGLIIR